ncbi:MAG: glycosyl hydrolase [Actinobacteria bacterium]|nr:MAG: glycosyl hydrolase [Actinomycetota bacterium]
MRAAWRTAIGVTVSCLWVLALAPPASAAPARPVPQCNGAPAPWLDPHKPSDERARLVLAQMTLDEKILELGSITDATHSRETPPIARLCIPALRLNNGSAGVSTGGPTQFPATALPAPIGLAATFDPRQARRYGVVEGVETKAQGRNLLEGPDVDLARGPVNGRTFEAYGEDPFLTGRIATADVRGVQSQGTIATVKHYAANNQETNRTTINELIDERTLHEIYLPGYEAPVRQGHSGAVMCAKNQVNNEFSCQHTENLVNTLRGRWGFSGFVMSDFNSCHDTVLCANNGMEFELPTSKFYSNAAIKAALGAGTVTQATIDGHVFLILRTMIRFGIFDRPQTVTPIDAVKDGAVSRDIAQQAAVLLKNSGATLPLDATALRSIAVVGPFAGAAMSGGGGSSHVKPLYTVSPVDGIQSRVGPGVTVTYAPGGPDAAAQQAAVDAAKAADVAVVMVGDNEAEGRDRPSLALTDNQDALVAAVAAANPRTVVVLKSGAPVLMPWIDQVPAILEAWYPGEEDGNVVASLLFGDVNPSGKLPITFPRNPGDVPADTPSQYPGVDGVATYSEGVFVGYRHYDAHDIAPLFPFGFGLSYTTFAMRQLRVDTDCSGATVTVQVTNTGGRTGAQVVQVYVGQPATVGVPVPPHQLGGFLKVTLRPGETRRVTIQVTPRAFAHWDVATHRFVVPDGTYQVLVGDSSRNLPLARMVRVRGIDPQN